MVTVKEGVLQKEMVIGYRDYGIDKTIIGRLFNLLPESPTEEQLEEFFYSIRANYDFAFYAKQSGSGKVYTFEEIQTMIQLWCV